MSRYGGLYGPDVTFLGIGRCDLDEPSTFAVADAVVIGAPFDGGTSYRAGCRFGPQAIRITAWPSPSSLRGFCERRGRG